jgi:5'-nucleotidase
MNNNRRKFLQNSSMLATGYLLAKPFKTIAGTQTNSFLNQRLKLNTVEIIHTSDIQGRLYPFAVGDLHNIGGLHNVHSVIKNISAKPVLVDAGNFLGGNARFTHDVAIAGLMNKVKYTAVTIGEKELLHGEAYLASLAGYMNFALVNCNYAFSNPILKAKILPYHIVRYGQYKIGITGVGPLPGGSYAENITCSHPYKKANEVAQYLKHQLNCNLVICLSQLGFEQAGSQPDNKGLATASENIDVIIGGNSTAIAHPQVILSNNAKQQVVVSTGGYGGSILGTLSFGFNQNMAMQAFNCKNHVPGSAAGSSFYSNYTKLRA